MYHQFSWQGMLAGFEDVNVIYVANINQLKHITVICFS